MPNNGIFIHPALQHERNPVTMESVVMLNGLIKARIQISSMPERRDPRSRIPMRYLQLQQSEDQQSGNLDRARLTRPVEVVPYLPPHFGDVTKLCRLDRKLFNFCKDQCLFCHILRPH
jgi:hypothetical protein